MLRALKDAGFQSAEYVRRLVEAERLAYADRNHYLGDPDFVEVPVETLISPEYLAGRRRGLPERGAGRKAKAAADAKEIRDLLNKFEEQKLKGQQETTTPARPMPRPAGGGRPPRFPPRCGRVPTARG